MRIETSPGVRELIRGLDRAVCEDSVEGITQGIKARLTDLTRNSGLQLPERFCASAGDSYARRLLHRDPKRGYTVVVMAWGPGQGTSLHDHAGMWCVECVVQGELAVTQYDLTEKKADRYRFEHQNCVRASVGDAGCLIPPFEYHVLSNALEDQTSVTLHVYSGEMERCNLYKPVDGGWWECSSRQLSYDE